MAMNTRKLLLPIFAALFGLAVSAFAQTQTTEATVAKVTGAATVTLPDGSIVPLTAGMKVAQGSTITTGADGDVYLESHAGYVTAIKQDSTVLVEEISVASKNGQVTKENTTLDLKSGNLIALLDPKKKAVNNYQVRTPKGVAAARGTLFSVKVNGKTLNITVNVVTGTIQFASPVDGLVTAVAAGHSTVSSPSGMVLGALGKDDITISDLATVAATVAIAAEKGIGGTTSAELAVLIKAIVTAVPEAATSVTAAVQQYAPSQSSTTTEVINSVPAAKNEQSAPILTPQPIDPSTVSRSNE